MDIKKTLFNTLLTFVCVLVALFAAEFILRAGSVDETSPEYLAQDAENSVILGMGLDKGSYRDLLASNVLGKLSFFEEGVEKDPEYFSAENYDGYPLIPVYGDPDYDSDTVNIVVLGDSFTWGQSSVDRNEIYWRLLENSLRSQGYNVRVYGVGMIGANSYDELKWLTDSSLVADLDPDIVIFGYLYNDPEPSGTIPSGSDGGAFWRAVTAVFPELGGRLRNFIDTRRMYSSDEQYYTGDLAAPILKGDIRAHFIKSFLRPLYKYASEADFPIALTTLPVYRGKALQKQLYAPLREMFDAVGNVGFYDATDSFFDDFVSSKHKDNYCVNIADGHPGSATNFFYAGFIEAFLKEDYADVLGKKADRSLLGDFPRINETFPKLSEPTGVSVEGSVMKCSVEYPRLDGPYYLFSEEIGDIWRIDRNYLTLPLDEDLIILSFSSPVDLTSIKLTSDGIADAQISYRRIDEKLGYDDHTVRAFGKRDGDVWTDDTPDLVTCLLIHADCIDSGGATLDLVIEAAGG